MRITELFTAQSIALDEALQTQEQILSRLVELQATPWQHHRQRGLQKGTLRPRGRGLYLCG